MYSRRSEASGRGRATTRAPLADLTNNRSHGLFRKPTATSTVPTTVKKVLTFKDIDGVHKDYLPEMYDHYFSVESGYCVNPSYMDSQPELTDRMREILIDWLIQVHHRFRLHLQTLYYTINFLDRFLERQLISRKKLQLAGVGAMLVAAKFEETFAPEISEFVDICAKAYTRDEIIGMETLICKKLEYKLAVPTTLAFAARFLDSVGANSKIRQMSCYAAERSLQEPEMLKHAPSTVAAAVVAIATEGWSPELEHYSHKTFAEVRPCISLLRTLLSKTPTHAYKYVYRKYCSPTRLHAANAMETLLKTTTFL